MNILRILEALVQIPSGLTIDELMDYCPTISYDDIRYMLSRLIDDGTVVVTKDATDEESFYRLSETSVLGDHQETLEDYRKQFDLLHQETDRRLKKLREKNLQEKNLRMKLQGKDSRIKQLKEENNRRLKKLREEQRVIEDLQSKLQHANHLVEARDQRIKDLHKEIDRLADEISRRPENTRYPSPFKSEEYYKKALKNQAEKIKSLKAANRYSTKAYQAETLRARAMYDRAMELSDRCDAVIRTLGELQPLYYAGKGGRKTVVNVDWIIKTLEGQQDG